MPFPDTNVVVPVCLAKALTRHCEAYGVKRDPLLRDLLDAYIDSQQARTDDERLTHIATLIWHPQMPSFKGEQDPHAYRLRLRIADATKSQAMRLALRLPGQNAIDGGHHDYRPRLLADAVLTAVAARITFTDEVLGGLPPVLTHGEAIGLFRLGVAASATRAERLWYQKADEIERGPADMHETYVRDVVGRLRDGDECWHGPRRRAVVRCVARWQLTDADVTQVRVELAAQDPSGGFGIDRKLLESNDEHRRDVLAAAGSSDGNSEGRGATAVWRAERYISLSRMVTWLSGKHPAELRSGHGRSSSLLIAEPGWRLDLPASWRAATVRHGSPDMPWLQAMADRREVLHVQTGGTHVFWPLRLSRPDQLPVPVPGIDRVLAAAGNHSDQEIIERLLIARTRGDVPVEAHMSADVAYNLQFIGRADRDRLATQARGATQRAMAPYLEVLPPGQHELRRNLRAAANCPAEFQAITHSLKYERACPAMTVTRFAEVRTNVDWPTPIISLATEVETGLTGSRLTWLTEHLFRQYDAHLAAAMRDRWEAALTGYRTAALLPPGAL